MIKISGQLGCEVREEWPFDFWLTLPTICDTSNHML